MFPLVKKFLTQLISKSWRGSRTWVTRLQASNDSVAEIEHDTPTPASVSISPDNDLIQVAFQFGMYLQSLPSKSATASQACKFVYLFIIKFSFWEILTRHGHLRGLIKVCPYLQLDGTAYSGTYVLSMNQTQFYKVTQA